MVSKYLKYSVLALSVAALLSGCGGGGGNSSTVSNQVNGKAIDGYLADATIQFDNCEGKPTIKTDTTGSFSFNPNNLGTCTDYSMTVTGGTDLLLKTPFTGSLKVKDDGSFKNKTAVTISPLTTLKANFTGSNEDFQKVLTNLGFPANTDINNYDPISSKDPVSESKLAVVQQLIQNIENAGGSITKLVEEIKDSTTPLFTSATSSLNQTILNSILTEVPTTSVVNSSNLISLADKLNDYATVATGSLSEYIESLTKTDKADEVQDLTDLLIKPSTYYQTFTFATFETKNLKAADTASKALSISQNNLLENLKLKIAATTSVTDLKDELQIAFDLDILGKGQIKAICNKIELSFGTDKLLKSVTIPAGTKITLIATDANGINVNKTDTTKTSYTFTPTNGEIKMSDIVNQSGFIQQVYSEQLAKLSVGDIAKANVFVKLKNYPIIDSNLPISTFNFGDTADQFTGSSISTYFKLTN